MSIASISYGSLKDASNEASAVAKKMDRYADAIHDSVYKKLNSYSGSWSSNLSTAKSKANAKINALRAEANKYERYSADLIDLKEQCEATDKSVRTKVKSLTATFKENHGIKNNPVVNTISYFFTSVGNSTSVGRWLGDGKDQFDTARNYLKDSIKEWYNFEGGKELIKGVLVGYLEVVVGVLAIVGAILTGGALLLVIAGVVAGAIAIINGYTNIANEGRAYYARRQNDPATGQRLSSLNTLTDTLRTEFDSRLVHGIAKGIDVINTVCTIATVVSGLGNLVKNGYKWATGNPASLDSLKIKDILTKENFLSFTGKLQTNLSQGWTRVSSAIATRDWTLISQTARSFGTDFATVFKGKYLDFKDVSTGLQSSSNILKASSDFIKDGLNIMSVGKIAFPMIPIAGLPGGGNITMDNFSSIIDDTSKVIENMKNKIFSSESLINIDTMEKLSQHSEINISVIDFQIPNISIDMPEIKLV